MSNVDQNKLVEILRLARASLNEELMQRQSEAYQQWHSSVTEAWKSNGMLLPPYRIKVAYPSEQDIVKKALEIYNTLTPTPELVTKQETPETMSAESFTAEVSEPENKLESEPVIEPVIEPVALENTATETTENKFKSLLTKWGGRGSF